MLNIFAVGDIFFIIPETIFFGPSSINISQSFDIILFIESIHRTGDAICFTSFSGIFKPPSVERAGF